jgi:SOS-response transcriptional repressor LexA
LLYVNGIHYKPILTGKIAKAHLDKLADLENQRFQDTLILIRKEMKEKEMKKQERELKKKENTPSTSSNKKARKINKKSIA